jgi:hypothetical protein
MPESKQTQETSQGGASEAGKTSNGPLALREVSTGLYAVDGYDPSRSYGSSDVMKAVVGEPSIFDKSSKSSRAGPQENSKE